MCTLGSRYDPDSSWSEEMSMVDWRWAAEKGFWDRTNQCFVEEKGGKEGYLKQRSMRAKRKSSCIQRAVVQAQVVSQGVFGRLWTQHQFNTVLPRYLWALEYQPHHVFRLMHSVTPRLRRAFEETLKLLLTCDEANYRTARLLSSKLCESADHQHPDMPSAAIRYQIKEAAQSMWELEPSFGILVFTFDPRAQSPCVHLNSRAAVLLGIQDRDATALLAGTADGRGAAALPVPELDALRMLAVGLGGAHAADGGPTYHRLLRRRGGETEGVLVSSVRKEHFDAAGRIKQVDVEGIKETGFGEREEVSDAGEVYRKT